MRWWDLSLQVLAEAPGLPQLALERGGVLLVLVLQVSQPLAQVLLGSLQGPQALAEHRVLALRAAEVIA